MNIQAKNTAKLSIAPASKDSIQPRKVLIPGMKRSLTTPDVYRASFYAITGSAIFLTAAVSSAVMSQRNAVQEVGFDTTPSVYNAQRIRDSVADLDANVANLLLPNLNDNSEAQKAYEERKDKLSKLVVLASKNITNAKEQDYISAIILGLNNYIEKVQTAKLLNSQKNREASIKVYREAQEIIDNPQTGLMALANELDKLNLTTLNDAYKAGQNSAPRQILIVFLMGVILLSTLIATQFAMARWSRRTLNPGLLGATIVASFFLLDTFVSLTTAQNELRVAKEDAFDSLHALRVSRSIAYSMNADESRYLLDPTQAAKHEADFNDRLSRLGSLSNASFASQPAQYQAEFLQITNNGKVPKTFTGLFATQLGNITFPGELKATQSMMRDFVGYLEIDRKIRELNRNKQTVEAIKLCTGLEEGQSNAAFKKFLKTHSDTMNVNIDAFNQSIQKAQKALDIPNPQKAITGGESLVLETHRGFDIFFPKILGITGAIVALSFFGINQRAKEYKA